MQKMVSSKKRTTKNPKLDQEWILICWDDTKKHEVKNSLDVDMDDQNEIPQATAKYGDGKYYPCSIVAKGYDKEELMKKKILDLLERTNMRKRKRVEMKSNEPDVKDVSSEGGETTLVKEKQKMHCSFQKILPDPLEKEKVKRTNNSTVTLATEKNSFEPQRQEETYSDVLGDDILDPPLINGRPSYTAWMGISNLPLNQSLNSSPSLLSIDQPSYPNFLNSPPSPLNSSLIQTSHIYPSSSLPTLPSNSIVQSLANPPLENNRPTKSADWVARKRIDELERKLEEEVAWRRQMEGILKHLMERDSKQPECAETEELNENLNGHSKEHLKDVCKKATNGKAAVRKLAELLFNQHQLVTCSVKGFKTRADQEVKPGLPAKSLQILNDFVRKYWSMDIKDQNLVLNDYLKAKRKG